MTFRPNFVGFAETKGDELVILGESPAPFPDHLHVYLEQDGHVAEGTVREPSTAWQVVFASAGFTSGRPASAFGVEIRTRPFGSSTWTETVEIP